MSAEPRWSPIDEETGDLLSLVRDEGHPSTDHEWDRFVQALEAASDLSGIIRPNFLRPLLRGNVAPRRIGAFTHRALSQGLLEPTGEWEVSDDTEGRNGGKPARIYRWHSQTVVSVPGGDGHDDGLGFPVGGSPGSRAHP